MAEATPEFIAEQLARVLAEQRDIRRELADMRDDRTVMVAILNRLDGSVNSLTVEMRAMRSQFDRLRSEVRERIRLDQPLVKP
jgi:hypothetical protein